MRSNSYRGDKYKGGSRTKPYLNQYKYARNVLSQAKQNVSIVGGFNVDSNELSLFEKRFSNNNNKIRTVYKHIPDMFLNPGMKKFYAKGARVVFSKQTTPLVAAGVEGAIGVPGAQRLPNDGAAIDWLRRVALDGDSVHLSAAITAFFAE